MQDVSATPVFVLSSHSNNPANISCKTIMKTRKILLMGALLTTVFNINSASVWAMTAPTTTLTITPPNFDSDPGCPPSSVITPIRSLTADEPQVVDPESAPTTQQPFEQQQPEEQQQLEEQQQPVPDIHPVPPDPESLCGLADKAYEDAKKSRNSAGDALQSAYDAFIGAINKQKEANANPNTSQLVKDALAYAVQITQKAFKDAGDAQIAAANAEETARQNVLLICGYIPEPVKEVEPDPVQPRPRKPLIPWIEGEFTDVGGDTR